MEVRWWWWLWWWCCVVVVLGWGPLGSSGAASGGAGPGGGAVEPTPTVASVVPRAHNLSCLSCHSVEDGDACIHPNRSETSLISAKCCENQTFCMAKRFSYVITHKNGTLTKPKTWSMERKCETNCESGCIIMGERTKLHVCISCCDQYLCNVDNHQPHIHYVTSAYLLLVSFMLYLLRYLGHYA